MFNFTFFDAKVLSTMKNACAHACVYTYVCMRAHIYIYIFLSFNDQNLSREQTMFTYISANYTQLGLKRV